MTCVPACPACLCFVLPVYVQIVSTNNDTVIKSVVVYCLDTGLFGGESFVVYPASPGTTVHIPLNPPSNTSAELRVQVRAVVAE